jgi:hypothetical protein
LFFSYFNGPVNPVVYLYNIIIPINAPIPTNEHPPNEPYNIHIPLMKIMGLSENANNQVKSISDKSIDTTLKNYP